MGFQSSTDENDPFDSLSEDDSSSSSESEDMSQDETVVTPDFEIITGSDIDND